MSHVTRRQAVKAVGIAGASYILVPSLDAVLTNATAIAASQCAKLTPAMTPGPFWVDTMLHRSDVRSNSHGGRRQTGVPLNLFINVFDASHGCKTLDGVAVDIWHANAHGLYSDEFSQRPGGGTTGGNTSKENWLRGYQITGRDRGLRSAPVQGQVSFKTIWPGWYLGRAIHIHVRIRKLSHNGATIAGYTTQIFFSDAANNYVLTGASPYNARSPQKDPTTDENDSVLRSSADATNIVAVQGSIARGYTTTFNVAVTTAEVSG